MTNNIHMIFQERDHTWHAVCIVYVCTSALGMNPSTLSTQDVLALGHGKNSLFDPVCVHKLNKSSTWKTNVYLQLYKPLSHINITYSIYALYLT